jgi:RNA polymerase sigma-70 factor (ECF subfamily)
MTDVREQKRLDAEFDALLMPLLGSAYGTAYHMLGNKEEAEDIVQEAALRAYRAFASFEKGTNFKAWFYQILVNCVRMTCRKRQRQPKIAPIEDAPDMYLYAAASSVGMMEIYENPAAQVIRKLSEEQIHAAIGALPEDYRMAAILYFVEDLGYQEIADVLECPVGTVRSRLHRGRKLLQKALWTVAQEHNVVAALCGGKEALTR